MSKLLRHERLLFSIALILSFSGLFFFQTMERQEDPTFPSRFGLIKVFYPGAAPQKIVQQLVKPLERQLAQVNEVKNIDITARQGLLLAEVQLHDEFYQTDEAWDKVRIALNQAQQAFPAHVPPPVLDDRIVGSSTMVLALTGADPLQLSLAADRIRDYLLQLPEIALINRFGDPGEQINVALDDAVLQSYAISVQDIAQQIQQANQQISGGRVILAEKSLVITPLTELQSLDALRQFVVTLKNGNTVPLASIANISHVAQQPEKDQVWWQEQRAVALEIRTLPDQVNVVAFGEQLRQHIAQIKPLFHPIQIEEMFYQPHYTEQRLSQLSVSLLYAILVILLVLCLSMGVRTGLVVSCILPLVALSSFAVYALGGGVLHQMAICGMVIALGILVDNAIVMTEKVQRHLDQGHSAQQAAILASRKLALPLFTATITTIVAFLPMLVSQGDTADFTRSIPIMIILALVFSFACAITVTPLLAKHFLRPAPVPVTPQTTQRFQINTEHMAFLLTSHPRSIIVLAIILSSLAIGSFFYMKHQFFPHADRNQIVVDCWLEEGSRIDQTAERTAVLAQALQQQPGVVAVHRFVGGSGPTFYYNILLQPNAPHQARLVINTDDLDRNQPLIEWIARFANENFPEVQLTASVLQQGPATKAPIEIRIYNPNPEALVQATEQVFSQLNQIRGTRFSRHDLGSGIPSIEYHIIDNLVHQLESSPHQIAQALLARSHGLAAGYMQMESERIPIKITSPAGENYDFNRLGSTILNAGEASIPIMQLVEQQLVFEAAAIYRRNQSQLSRVYSDLAPGYVYSEILTAFNQALQQQPLPPGTRIEFGGDVGASQQANDAILRFVPATLGLLFLCLLFQFNSFRRVLIILLSIPFALAGVFPGLLLLGYPFGFQAIQGVITLAGIVINHAILLIDEIDQQLSQDKSLEHAIQQALIQRTRPILLTAATTICGLLPLAFSNTSLWPPMAWTIIFGLISATLLTLFVLPAICRVCLAEKVQR